MKLIRQHVDFLFIAIFYAKTLIQYGLIIELFFGDLLICYFSFATFFQKQASKYHLTQGNLLKTMLLNEKQSNVEEEIYGNIFLYSQYFSPGAGSNVHKIYFYFLRLTKIFYFIFLDQKRSI